jgi:hypothetical protein
MDSKDSIDLKKLIKNLKTLDWSDEDIINVLKIDLKTLKQFSNTLD